MANLTVRNIDDDIHAALKRAATANGRSMEAELRAVLRSTYGPDAKAGRTLGEAFRDMNRRFVEATGGLTEEEAKLFERDQTPPRTLSID